MKSQLNILAILGNNPFLDSNAANNRFLGIAEELVNNNCKVEILILNCANNRNERNNITQNNLPNNIYCSYLAPYYIENKLMRKLFFKLYFFLFSTLLVKKIVKKNNYDILWLGVHTRVTNIGLKIFHLKKTFNFKIFHERSEYSWIGMGNNKRIHYKYLNEFLPKIDCLAIMTKTLIDYYKDFLNPRTIVIHLPMTVNLNRFNKSDDTPSKKTNYIAYCGTMNNHKDGVNILIQSFADIINLFPNVNLYLAGELTPQEDCLMQQEIIKKYNATNRIVYKGALTKDEIPDFLLNATILAMARPKTKQTEGGFPTKLGEYLATGNPVCVTDIGEISNYLKDGESAYIAQPNSIESFTNVLKRALTDHNAKDVGLNGQQIAHKFFNSEIQAKILYDCLTKLKKD